jgi:hypothetical protein
MNTGKNNSGLDFYLENIPGAFRGRIVKEYLNIKSRFRKGDFDSSGLSCGKFCEQNLRFLQHCLTGTHIGFAEEIKNFQFEISKLEKVDKSKGNDSLRIIIPRALAFLYTLRNKRNIGHSGGDVEANQIDSLTIGRISDWIICELIRIFHDKSLEEAQRIIDFISSREVPIIWEVNGKKRVLKNNSSAKEKVLLLTYSQEDQGVFFEDLISWVEYQNKAGFKSKVLNPLHTEGMIEFDKELNMIFLSPKGSKKVEDIFLKENIIGF